MEVLVAENEQRARTLQLVRRWPGDENHEEHLTFDFPYGINGTVSIEYEQAQEFRVYDASGAQGILLNVGSDDLYLHPVERGTL